MGVEILPAAKWVSPMCNSRHYQRRDHRRRHFRWSAPQRVGTWRVITRQRSQRHDNGGTGTILQALKPGDTVGSVTSTE